MKGRKTLFSSLSPHWQTPKAVYAVLDDERVCCNPPDGQTVGQWLAKEVWLQYRIIISIRQPGGHWGEWREYTIAYNRPECAKKIKEERKMLRSSGAQFRIKILVEML